jgi:DNA modification methylase
MPGVAPACAGPRTRDASLGGQGQRGASHLQLRPDKQQGPVFTGLFHLAHSAAPRREKLHGRHPTQKPLRLVRRALVACTREGELVFDPFCGSGTTAVAAKELNRSFVGAELEEEYAELAARRVAAAERGGVLREISGQPVLE